MDKYGTDFLDDVVGRTTRPRFNRWGGEIVIDGNGQVRFHQKVLYTLGELPEQPRVLVASPDNKTVTEIVDTIVYYKSKSSKGMKYPDALTFTNPSVDVEQKTVTISTDDIEQK